MKKAAAFLTMLMSILLLSTYAFGLDKGDRVLVLWEDAYWYPGTVQEKVSDGAVLVHFDDGDKATADVQRVEKLDWQAGDLVECRWSCNDCLSNDKMFPGRFVKVDGEKARIVYDDGDKADVKVGRCRQSRQSRLTGR